MTLSYDFTFDDWVAFNRHHLRNSPAHQRMRLYVRLMFVPIAAIIVGLRWLRGQEVLGLSVAFLVVAIIWYCLYPLLFDRRVVTGLKRMLREGNNQALLGEHTLTSSTEGFRVIYPGGDSFHKWASIEKVDYSEDYVFIYTSSVHATVIPKHSLRGMPFDSALEEIKIHTTQRA